MPTASTTPILNARQILADEFAHVRGISSPNPDTVYDDALRLRLSALCLSGGGIRSAAFCLGVLQSLAGKDLLQRFDYLSTVSGGGFIGGWLQQVIREEVQSLPPEQRDALGAEDRVALAARVLSSHEPPPLDRLRDNTNYLTPKAGPASADTWAGAALYIRNLTLNWIVFAPVFLLAALAPIFHRTLIWWAGTSMATSAAWTVSLLLGFMLLLGYGVFQACHWLPSHRSSTQRVGSENRAQYLRATGYIVATAIAWSMLLPISLQSLLAGHEAADANGVAARWFHNLAVIPVLYFLVLAISYEIAARWPTAQDKGKVLFWVNRIHWLFAAVGSAMLLALLLHLLLLAHPYLVEHESVADVLTLAAPVTLLCVLLAHTTFYLGLRREALYGNLDREWLARMNGVILGIGAAWTLFAAACLIASLLTLPGGEWKPLRIGFAALSTMASGFASSWLGKQVISRVQSLTGGDSNQQRTIKIVQSVLPIVFVVALFALLGSLVQLGLGSARPWFGSPPATGVDSMPVALQLILGLVLVVLIVALGRIVNVNRFSMHAVYRNRLTRAFLGTPRSHRRPDPFTGFDDQDDPRLKEFLATGNAGQRLFPVINITLNISTGGRDAWAERKGSSFTATPLHCGAAELRPRGHESEQVRPGAYVRTDHFAGMESDQDELGNDQGTHLGSMLTISGAAASPNWGYHSAPQIAFLMTLFNVRLGAWYPNPARATPAELRLAKPRNSLLALFNELCGRTTDDNQAVYLSDGGHFENLGVYEMLRRRCTRIVVIDAGQDGGCKFFDLGMMIRKAEIDLPVKIRLATTYIASRKAIAEGHASSARGFAHGIISYVDHSGREIGSGEIVYIKPCLLPDAPAAVRAFAADNDAFPHESTADQWFSESQFESYRSLGQHQGAKLTALLPTSLPINEDRLQALFDATRKYFTDMPPSPERDEIGADDGAMARAGADVYGAD
jgi:hypothetical protein